MDLFTVLDLIQRCCLIKLGRHTTSPFQGSRSGRTLASAGAGMLLKLYQKFGNLLQRGHIATLLDDSELRLGLLGKKYGIGHGL